MSSPAVSPPAPGMPSPSWCRCLFRGWVRPACCEDEWGMKTKKEEGEFGEKGCWELATRGCEEWCNDGVCFEMEWDGRNIIYLIFIHGLTLGVCHLSGAFWKVPGVREKAFSKWELRNYFWVFPFVCFLRRFISRIDLFLLSVFFNDFILEVYIWNVIICMSLNMIHWHKWTLWKRN